MRIKDDLMQFPIKNVRNFFAPFFNFLRTHLIGLLITIFFALLAYGQKLFSNRFSLDTEGMIQWNNTVFRGWIQLDRSGIVIFKKLVGWAWYNNAFASFLMVVFLTLATIIWSYVWYEVQGEPHDFYLAYYTVPMITAPIMAEQFNFLLQAPEDCLALMFCAIATLWTYRAVYYRNIVQRIVALTLSTMLVGTAFSFYTAFTTVFIFGIATAIVFQRNRTARHSTPLREQLTLFFYGVGVAIIGYALYFIGNRLVQRHLGITTSEYITEQMRWGKDPLTTIVHHLLEQAAIMYSGKTIFYTLLATGMIVLFEILIVLRVVAKKISPFQTFVGILLAFSPMLMPVLVGGSEMQYRTHLTYPMLFAFATGIVLQQIMQYKLGGYIAIVALLIIGFTQGGIVNRLLYTEALAYEHDVQLSYAIEKELKKNPHFIPGKTGVIAVGNTPMVTNPDTFKREDLQLNGRSFFSINFGNIHGILIKNNFMNAQGLGNPFGDMELAIKRAKTMSIFPQKGSIVIDHNTAIVKVGPLMKNDW